MLSNPRVAACYSQAAAGCVNPARPPSRPRQVAKAQNLQKRPQIKALDSVQPDRCRLCFAPLRAVASYREAPMQQQPLNTLHEHVSKVLFSEQVIADRVAELGSELAKDYAHKAPLLVGTLSGAFMFMADLARRIAPVPDGLAMDFLRASSYGGTATESSGTVTLSMQLKTPLQGRHVLLVEDIVDTGTTAQKLMADLRAQGAASVELVALLNKSPRRTVDIQPRYCGFECPDEFVIGYGLDYDEMYRSLPYIGVLKPECYQ